MMADYYIPPLVVRELIVTPLGGFYWFERWLGADDE
jgi:hypothetical protein